ncbi:redoxin domain-containing protein [Stieleria sp. JC731]|uniref:redoxin domain-containing protein n=1 Tax=Pirellulaceae TaxID=2691357 RepID=UPI001E35C4BC|nr:redoxin domain-containing protein [Stieleria sp. JC731]MCC9602461.1 redoxin domain-containing protein [Stieleria sp. JC731]
MTFRILLVAALAILPIVKSSAVEDNAVEGEVVDDASKQIAPGHNLLADQSVEPVGQSLRGLAFRTVDGDAVYLNEVVAKGPAVFVFSSTVCPLAKRYSTRLSRIQDEFANSGVQLFVVFANSDETDAAIKEYAQRAKYSFPCIRDINGYLADRFGATMTPQVFVVDRQCRLRYRGAIDDNRYEDRVSKNYLRDALQQLVPGDAITLASTPSMGCSIHVDKTTEDDIVTYSGQIARIIQDRCQSCHRDGQIAPFALRTYEDAVRWKTEIAAYTKSRVMPPWKASQSVGHFSNDISLSDDEIDLISRWVEQGSPMGEASEIPPTPKYNDKWEIGQPDLVLEMPEPYTIGPEGEDDYRHFIIPYEADKDRFVQAIDVQPGNRNTVHHVIVYVDTSGRARELDAEDPGPGYTRFGDVGFDAASMLGGWAPGMQPIQTPEGTGRWLPKKCDIVVQVHYYRTGFEEQDQTQFGLYFSKAEQPVPTQMQLAINHRFVIPPGEKRHQVNAQCRIHRDSYLFGITPHMHLLGETMSVNATLPSGEDLPLIRIDDWDFNWQTMYRYNRLQKLPAGTIVSVEATFDNSDSNPNNPNHPPRPVGWGEKTTDEMCIAFLSLVPQSDYDPDSYKLGNTEVGPAEESVPKTAETEAR